MLLLCDGCHQYSKYTIFDANSCSTQQHFIVILKLIRIQKIKRVLDNILKYNVILATQYFGSVANMFMNGDSETLG